MDIPQNLAQGLQAQREPQLRRAVSRLHQVVAELDDATAHLHARLEDVMRPRDEAAASAIHPEAPRNPEPVAPAASELDTIAQRLENTLGRIGHIHSHLEI